MFAEGEVAACIANKLSMHCKKSTEAIIEMYTQGTMGLSHPRILPVLHHRVLLRSLVSEVNLLRLIIEIHDCFLSPPNKTLLKIWACRAKQCFDLLEMHAWLFRF